MLIRNTKPEEIDEVMTIYDLGREYMRANGNANQWTNGYPPKSLIEDDIKNGYSYVVENDEGNIVSVFAFIQKADPTYSKIFEGSWPDDKPYSVIHRISVTEHKKGIASFVYNWALTKSNVIRIDTHKDNIPMQNALKKNGFKYCGIIYIEDGSPRLAFQKNKGWN